MESHKKLRLRKPENSSLFRTTPFNKIKVMEYFDNYERALKPWNFIAGRVCNIDDTGVSRDVESRNFVAQIGTKKVGQAVYGV